MAALPAGALDEAPNPLACVLQHAWLAWHCLSWLSHPLHLCSLIAWFIYKMRVLKVSLSTHCSWSLPRTLLSTCPVYKDSNFCPPLQQFHIDVHAEKTYL